MSICSGCCVCFCVEVFIRVLVLILRMEQGNGTQRETISVLLVRGWQWGSEASSIAPSRFFCVDQNPLAQVGCRSSACSSLPPPPTFSHRIHLHLRHFLRLLLLLRPLLLDFLPSVLMSIYYAPIQPAKRTSLLLRHLFSAAIAFPCPSSFALFGADWPVRAYNKITGVFPRKPPNPW